MLFGLSSTNLNRPIRTVVVCPDVLIPFLDHILDALLKLFVKQRARLIDDAFSTFARSLT